MISRIFYIFFQVETSVAANAQVNEVISKKVVKPILPRLLKRRTRATTSRITAGDGTNAVEEEDNDEQIVSKKAATENSKVKKSSKLLPTAVSKAQKSEKKISNNETKSSQKKKDSPQPIKLKVLKDKSTDKKVPIKDCIMPEADEFGASPANENDGKIDNQKSPMIISSKNDSENGVVTLVGKKKPKVFSKVKGTKKLSSDNLENSCMKNSKVILPQDESTESAAAATTTEESSSTSSSMINVNKQLKKINKIKTSIRPSMSIGNNDKPTPSPVDIRKVKTETNQPYSKQQLTDVNKQQEKEKNYHTVASSNIKQELLQNKKLVITKQLSNIGKQPTNVRNSTRNTQLLQSKKILINKQLNNVGKRSTSPAISLQRVKKDKLLDSDSFEQQQSPKKINKNVNKQLTSSSTVKNKQTVTPSSTDESTGSDRENCILPQDLPSRKKEQIDLGKVKDEKAAAVAKTNEINCNRCDQIFIHTFEKIIHKKSAKGDGVPFVCEICNFRSCTKDGLAIHQRAEHQKNTN